MIPPYFSAELPRKYHARIYLLVHQDIVLVIGKVLALFIVTQRKPKLNETKLRSLKMQLMNDQP